jgi:hypothetical protein
MAQAGVSRAARSVNATLGQKVPTDMKLLDEIIEGRGQRYPAHLHCSAQMSCAGAAGQRKACRYGDKGCVRAGDIATIGDLRTFDYKLDAFQNGGFISSVQRDAMRATLDVGDAAMHRGHLPAEQDLRLALDIVEGVFAPIFVHKDQAQKLSDAVPPRKRPSPLSR